MDNSTDGIDFELAFKEAKRNIEESRILVQSHKGTVNLSRAYIALLRGYENNRIKEV